MCIILISTVIAVGIEIYKMFQNRSVTLADLLLMFLYLEVLAMVRVFWNQQSISITLPLLIAITALARFIILQGKEMDPTALVYEAVAIVLIAGAIVILRLRHSDKLGLKKKNQNSFSMKFETSRAKALDKLNYFIENNLSEYSKLRNFDFGPENRSNISCLSPYVTHGIVDEKEIIKKSLSKFSFSKNEKFIQEVLWRTYWKGWLELRPNVWSDYLIELSKIREDFKNNQNYLNAIDGKTNIECFNSWVNELKDHNYLHNHTRMWFASIWIFTLELPWQLGAEFFMQHLYDGDAASNTLGWRWVAGVQTKGKHYLASEWNIKKFTNNRFNNIKLNENALPKVSEKTYSIIKQDFNNPQNIEDKNLLIFENNLSFEITDFHNNKFKKIYLISNKNENRSHQT